MALRHEAIPDAIRREFSRKTRGRGMTYARGGYVDDLYVVDDGAFGATVMGSYRQSYTVSGHREDGVLVVSCECPHFGDAFLCKHIYAVLLTLADEDALPRDVSDIHSDWELLDDFDELLLPEVRPRPPEPTWRLALQSLPPTEPAPSRSVWDDALTKVVTQQPRLIYLLRVHDPGGRASVSVHLAEVDEAEGPRLLRPMPQHEAWTQPWLLAQDNRALRALNMFSDYWGHGAHSYQLGASEIAQVLPALAGTERFYLAEHDDALGARVLLADGSLRLSLSAKKRRSGGERRLSLTVRLRGEHDEVDIARARRLGDSHVVVGGSVSRVEPADAARWLDVVSIANGPLDVSADESAALLHAVVEAGGLELLESVDAFDASEQAPEPRPHLTVQRDDHRAGQRIPLELRFEYGAVLVAATDGRATVVDEANNVIVRRDAERERAAIARLYQLGAKRLSRWAAMRLDESDGVGLGIARTKVFQLASALVAEGWHVVAEGKRVREIGGFDFEVSSGIDWFELRGGMRADDVVVPFSRLLAALRSRKKTGDVIDIGGGELGVMSPQWQRKLRALLGGADKAKADGETLRLARSQLTMLDVLLAESGDARVDADVKRARKRLHRVDKLAPAGKPRGFRGELRSYQREGLAWLTFLDDIGLGGCLADDMGLGKTIQVLALIARWRARRNETHLPCLVVAPRSVVDNWIDEAARFTPRLRCLRYLGPDRAALRDQLRDFDLVVTSYDTLRRDAAHLCRQRFRLAVLDEAQAIKNHKSQRAKAARLLDAELRLALTGTPVENRPAELWSIFEFLNPGLLAPLANSGDDSVELDIAARAIKPLLLRRTKAAVAKELPDRSEQLLRVELSEPERVLYDELLASYRQSLLAGKTSTMHVLEALLRLRQAACHPALIDRRLAGSPSAKLELLVERLGELRDEGHRALVFSQFTKLLALLRSALDDAGVGYAYLDGRTRKRSARIDAWRTAPEATPHFLISLKAGGVGLNLTEASYVFLLDPWWNPAVEAQAIDRTHRIGQREHVHAYRLIARDTIEERVLELQERKRAIADSLIGGAAAGLGDLTREDLEQLLA